MDKNLRIEHTIVAEMEAGTLGQYNAKQDFQNLNSHLMTSSRWPTFSTALAIAMDLCNIRLPTPRHFPSFSNYDSTCIGSRCT